MQRALGGALTEQANLAKPSFDERIQHLLDVADAAAELHRLLTAVDNGWNAWSEARMSMGDIALETGKPSAWDESSIDPGRFPWAVSQIAMFAKATASRLKRRKRAAAPDTKHYVAELGQAYFKFFDRPPGISTDAEDGTKHGGLFVRFAQAAAREVDIDLPASQIRDCLRAARQISNRGRKT